MMMKSIMMLAILSSLDPASSAYSATTSAGDIPASQPFSTGQQGVPLAANVDTPRRPAGLFVPRGLSITFGNYGPWPTNIVSPAYWDSGTASTGEQLIRHTLLSPGSFSVSNPSTLYSPQDRLIAHRGLVDLANGIAENSLESVKNAFNHGINLVEIDVQSTSDGVAVPLHDDSLSRPFNISQNVENTTFGFINNRPILIKNPLYNIKGGGGVPYARSSSQLLSLDSLLHQALQANLNATFFLDPKNLNAAEAAARVVMKDGNLASHVIMKTYTAYWGSNDANEVVHQATSGAQFAALQTMQIMPVDNETGAAGGMGSNAAFQNVMDDAGQWGQYFRVPAIELPGYWDPNWQTLKNHLTNEFARSILQNNPVKSNGLIYQPVLSTGYRYEDFALSGQAYDWGMDGQPKADTVNATRRTVGAERNSDGWITTDVPLQEAYAIIHSRPYSESGNAYVDFPSVPAENYGSGNTGDQGGP